MFFSSSFFVGQSGGASRWRLEGMLSTGPTPSSFNCIIGAKARAMLSGHVYMV